MAFPQKHILETLTRAPRGALVRRGGRRAGKALAFLVVSLPAVLGILGLMFDAGYMMAGYRNAQHAADAAATAAAMELRQGHGTGSAISKATVFVHTENNLGDASVSVNHPPASGPYAGETGYVEVILSHPHQTSFIHVLGGGRDRHVKVRAVAGIEDATAGAAIMVLDPDPPKLTLPILPPLLPGSLALLAGLEVTGLGQARVDGAVLVNTQWGGVDEDGNPAGSAAAPPYAVSCLPVLGLSRLAARDIRVVGGVDDPANYRNFDGSGESPLVANRLPTVDPFEELPPPSTSADSSNVSTALRGGVRVLQLPFLQQTTLQPGVYEWIEVVSGTVRFEPGVYIIRGVNPLTRISLNLLAGNIEAEGVMFYITDSTNYSAATGAPDVDDDLESPPGGGQVLGLVPSAMINLALLGGALRGIDDPSSPYDGMLLFQNKLDRRPIVMLQTSLLGQVDLSGTIYAKYGHLTFGLTGTLDLRIVTGSLRLVPLGTMTLAPTNLLPPAREVFLVE